MLSKQYQHVLIMDVTQNKPSGHQLIIQDDTASEAAPNLWIVTHA